MNPRLRFLCLCATIALLPACTATCAGETRRDDKSITWVWMPSGSFHLGCEPQDSDCDSNEKPGSLRQVEGFWMAQTETTVAAYQACVRAGACGANQLEGDYL
jgi:formylglycine-generating enzyme required for sulfatase activity